MYNRRAGRKEQSIKCSVNFIKPFLDKIGNKPINFTTPNLNEHISTLATYDMKNRTGTECARYSRHMLNKKANEIDFIRPMKDLGHKGVMMEEPDEKKLT